jgi:hypothetical protein
MSGIMAFFKRKKKDPNLDQLIRVLLNDESNEKRNYAAIQLGRLKNPKAVPYLLEAARDRHSRVTSNTRFVQVTATEAIGEIGGKEAVDALGKLIRQSYGGIQHAAFNGLKKLAASDIIDKYYQYWSQQWYAIILNEEGKIVREEWNLEERHQPTPLEKGDYVRVEYSIARVDDDCEPVDRDTPTGHEPYYMGFVDLEVKNLHVEETFTGFSTIDMTGEPADLTPIQKEAIKRYLTKTPRGRQLWSKSSKKIKLMLE